MATEKSFRLAMASLPLDILINQIFTKLPVRSLLRCRSVCKQWLQLLTDPEFIAMHFEHQKLHHHQKILCGPIFDMEGCPGESEEDYRAELRACHGVFYSLDLQSSSADAVRLPGFPIHLKNYRFIQTLGYCNGMVCMLVCNYSEKESYKSERLLIGNPSTGHYRILPEPTSLPLLIGFGCDSSLDDYKCVCVDYLTRNPHIFSLKLNSWRTNLGLSDNYAINRPKNNSYNVGIAVDRSIYWLVEISNMIVEFDLKDEEFRELPLPSDRRSDEPNSALSIKVLEGSLCIINVCHKNNEVDMWLMLKQEENKKKENNCWSKLMTMIISATEFGTFFKIDPLCIMKDGKVLCCLGDGLEENSTVLIDHKTKRVEYFSIRDEIGCDWLKQYTFEAPHVRYIDSLVSPN